MLKWPAESGVTKPFVPANWGLVEEPLNLAQVLSEHGQQNPAPCLLIDCMSLWISNLLHAGTEQLQAQKRLS